MNSLPDPILTREDTPTSATERDAPLRERTGWSISPIFTIIVSICLFLSGMLITFLRVSGDRLDLVWAEDGTVFLSQALHNGPLAVLFEGYEGYQHLIPRVVAGTVLSLFPLSWYAIAVVVSCAILTGAAAVAVYLLSRSVLPWIPAQIGVAAITFLIPLSGNEVAGNLSNFHTYCFWVGLWLVFARPRSTRESVIWSVVALVCALTEVQMLYLLLIVPFRLRQSDRKAWPIFGAILVGGIVQIATVLVVERQSESVWLGFLTLLKSWFVGGLLPLVETRPDVQRLILDTTGPLVPGLILLLALALTVFSLIFGSGLERLLAAGLMITAPLLFMVSATANGGFFLATNSRYGVISGMLLATLLALACSVGVRRWPRKLSRRIAGSALIVMLAGFAIVSAHTSPIIMRTLPSWSSSIEQAQRDCREAASDSRISLPLLPGHWLVHLDCATVLEH